jgi:hypothetical protein
VYLGLLVYATLLAERRGDATTRRHGDTGTGRVGDGETGGQGDGPTGRRGEEAIAAQGDRALDSASPRPRVAASPRRRVAASPRLATMYRPVSAVGLIGLAVAVVSLVAWLLLRYPGPEAIPGTYGSVVLALMVLAVVVIGTVIARGAEDRRPTGDPR